MSKQEPTAWMSEDGDLIMDYDKPHNSHEGGYDIPLYTHPQRRLSKDEILDLAHRICKKYTHNGDEPYAFDDGCMTHFANAIMDKMMDGSNE